MREHADRGFERDEALALLARLIGKADEPFDFGGKANQGRAVLVVAWPEQFEGDRKAEIGDEWKWMRRIDGKRRQDRKNMGQEMLAQPFRFRLVEIRRIDQRYSRALQLLAQLAPAALLFRRQKVYALADLGKLFGRRKPVLGWRRDSGAHLAAKTGNPHHEEFVEIVGGNRQKPQLFEQGMIAVRGLQQDPPVEFEPGQFAVDEALRR